MTAQNIFQRHLSVRRRALSMLELLIVMVVMAVLIAMGAGSVGSFKTSSEFNTGLSEFESVVQSVRNAARNNVTPKRASGIPTPSPADPFVSRIKGYMIYFDGVSWGVYSCITSAPDILDCNHPEAGFQNKSAMQVQSGDAEGGNVCAGILFRNLTGDMDIVEAGSVLSQISETNDLNQSADCFAKVVHPKNPTKYEQYFIFSHNENVFERVSTS